MKLGVGLDNSPCAPYNFRYSVILFDELSIGKSTFKESYTSGFSSFSSNLFS